MSASVEDIGNQNMKFTACFDDRTGNSPAVGQRSRHGRVSEPENKNVLSKIMTIVD
jgi:hypothetical protein